MRRAALAGLAVLQALVIVGATLWLSTRTEAAEPRSASVPVTWRAVVRDTGGALLNLRTAPEVASSNASRTAASGDSLDILCGQTGDTVSGAPGRTGVWLKTADQLYVSQLYVAVPGQTRIPRCPEPDLLLIEMPIHGPAASAAPDQEPAVLAGGASDPPAQPGVSRGCGESGCQQPEVGAVAAPAAAGAGTARHRPIGGATTGSAEAADRPGPGKQDVDLGVVSNAPTTTTSRPRPGGGLGDATDVKIDHDRDGQAGTVG